MRSHLRTIRCVRITLRDEELPDNKSVVVHLGIGTATDKVVDDILAATIRNHDAYINVHPSQPGGAFTVSVFIAVNDEQELRILRGFKHGRFGKQVLEEVAREHVLWPTTTTYEGQDPSDFADLHWDVILQVEGLPEIPPGTNSTLLPPELLEQLRDALRPPLVRLLELFDPRTERLVRVESLQLVDLGDLHAAEGTPAHSQELEGESP